MVRTIATTSIGETLRALLLSYSPSQTEPPGVEPGTSEVHVVPPAFVAHPVRGEMFIATSAQWNLTPQE